MDALTPQPGPPPLVTVVTATYNRSNVLRYAIASLLASSFADWELRVIGDACTDDTEAVVRGFGDPRIHFTNLTQNVGEQSGPNNEGMRQARGRFIAFLNHDDLWFPDHLSSLLAGIEESHADMVFGLGLGVLAADDYCILGATGRGFWPLINAPATLWLFRRELVDTVGAWRFYRECYGVPSQDWIYRVWRAGKVIRCVPRLTAVVVPSTFRLNSYANRDHVEQETAYRRMVQEPDFRTQMLTRVAVVRTAESWELPVTAHLYRALRTALFAITLRLGITPMTVRDVLRGRRKGSIVDRLRHRRGLPSLRGR